MKIISTVKQGDPNQLEIYTLDREYTSDWTDVHDKESAQAWIKKYVNRLTREQIDKLYTIKSEDIEQLDPIFYKEKVIALKARAKRFSRSLVNHYTILMNIVIPNRTMLASSKVLGLVECVKSVQNKLNASYYTYEILRKETACFRAKGNPSIPYDLRKLNEIYDCFVNNLLRTVPATLQSLMKKKADDLWMYRKVELICGTTLSLKNSRWWESLCESEITKVTDDEFYIIDCSKPKSTPSVDARTTAMLKYMDVLYKFRDAYKLPCFDITCVPHEVRATIDNEYDTGLRLSWNEVLMCEDQTQMKNPLYGCLSSYYHTTIKTTIDPAIEYDDTTFSSENIVCSSVCYPTGTHDLNNAQYVESILILCQNMRNQYGSGDIRFIIDGCDDQLLYILNATSFIEEAAAERIWVMGRGAWEFAVCDASLLGNNCLITGTDPVDVQAKQAWERKHHVPVIVSDAPTGVIEGGRVELMGCIQADTAVYVELKVDGDHVIHDSASDKFSTEIMRREFDDCIRSRSMSDKFAPVILTTNAYERARTKACEDAEKIAIMARVQTWGAVAHCKKFDGPDTKYVFVTDSATAYMYAHLHNIDAIYFRRENKIKVDIRGNTRSSLSVHFTMRRKLCI